jgi:hypothetical protein
MPAIHAIAAAQPDLEVERPVLGPPSPYSQHQRQVSRVDKRLPAGGDIAGLGATVLLPGAIAVDERARWRGGEKDETRR